ncbi:MAG: isochorismatase family protein [Planctomycetota bacterium]|nr:isochorismatase family protein [Planctomycetota bacterium]
MPVQNRRFVASTLIATAIVGGAALVAGTATSSTAQSATAQASNARTTTWAPGGKRERWTPDNCVFAFIDHQTGLMNLVNDTSAAEYRNYVVGLAKLAKIHNIPSVITTSAEDGPNGPKVPEVVALLPGAPYIKRNGQINAWEDPAFVDAIKKTGRTKIVMAGITTDVCVAFAALSALDAGFEVYVVSDASGSMSEQTQLASLMRMQDAGAIIGTWFALSCEMLYDWRNAKGAETAQLFVEHFPAYAEIYHSHQAASRNRK